MEQHNSHMFSHSNISCDLPSLPCCRNSFSCHNFSRYSGNLRKKLRIFLKCAIKVNEICNSVRRNIFHFMYCNSLKCNYVGMTLLGVGILQEDQIIKVGLHLKESNYQGNREF